MRSILNLETLKLVGGATIVLTAICIMLPGVMGYAFSLARLGLIILVAVLASSALAFLFQVLVKRKKPESVSEKPDTNTTEVS
jgi:hypothetical protein